MKVYEVTFYEWQGGHYTISDSALFRKKKDAENYESKHGGRKEIYKREVL